jgi:hypothetical protein
MSVLYNRSSPFPAASPKLLSPALGALWMLAGCQIFSSTHARSPPTMPRPLARARSPAQLAADDAGSLGTSRCAARPPTTTPDPRRPLVHGAEPAVDGGVPCKGLEQVFLVINSRFFYFNYFSYFRFLLF